MTRSRPMSLVARGAVVPLVALLIAGCGNDDGTATGGVAPPKTPAGKLATIGVTTTGLGMTLVDSRGRTLYLFKRDTGWKSTCFGACASAWPPLRASGTPTVGIGASASKLATTPRSDGGSQLTYNGHPLYLYEGDGNPGETNGQGVSAFGGGWYALAPAGKQISGAPAASGVGWGDD